MKKIKTEEMVQLVNPTPSEPYRVDLVTSEERAKDLGGFMSIIPSGGKLPYHYHEKRESLLFIIKGEAVEIVEGVEHPVKPGDVLYIPASEKHTIVNQSNGDLRNLEFFTPVQDDFIIVE